MSEEMGGETLGSETTTTEIANTDSTGSQPSGSMERAPSEGAFGPLEAGLKSSKAGPEGANIDAQAAAAAIAAYTPNFRYTVPGEKEKKELEFDDWAKKLIKDSDTEKKVRDLYTKAGGLDHLKNARDKFKSEAETLRGEYSDTKKALGVLSGYVEKNDMQSFFEALKIPEDKVLKYALDRIQYRELPPEKRQEYDQMRDATRRAAILEDQNKHLYEQYEKAQVESRSRDLETTLSDPNITQVSQAFDQRMGAGAFRNEVIRRGQYYWAVNKQDIPPAQAVQEVLRMIGGVPQAPAMNPNLSQAVTPDATPVDRQASEKKPTIPNIQGKGTSPAKRLPKSISDLKKLRSEAS